MIDLCQKHLDFVTLLWMTNKCGKSQESQM
jgi:hypothetical protein